jgi:hypothetical protein
MINLKINEITQQKIKEIKIYNIDDRVYYISEFSLNSETTLHNLKNVKIQYKNDLQSQI